MTALILALSLAGQPNSSQSTNSTIGVNIQNSAFIASSHVMSGAMCGSSSHDGYHHHAEIRKVEIAPDAKAPTALSKAGLSCHEDVMHQAPAPATNKPSKTNVAFVNRYSSRLNCIGRNYFSLRHDFHKSRSCFSHGIKTTARATSTTPPKGIITIRSSVHGGGGSIRISSIVHLSPKRIAATTSPPMMPYIASTGHPIHRGASPVPLSSSKSKLAETIGQRNLRSQVIQRKNNVSKRHAANPIHRFMAPAYGGA